jgi:hypothetical protein
MAVGFEPSKLIDSCLDAMGIEGFKMLPDAGYEGLKCYLIEIGLEDSLLFVSSSFFSFKFE